MRKLFLLVLLTTVTMVSCSSSSSDDPASNDPFVGNWRVVAFVENGSVIDVTPEHIPCFKNSTLMVDATSYTLNFFAPKQQGSTECNSATLSGTWRNDNGRYYFKAEGQQEADMQAVFNDNNTTLQFPMEIEGKTVMVVFKKS